MESRWRVCRAESRQNLQEKQRQPSEEPRGILYTVCVCVAMHVPFEIFHLPLCLIHFCAIQVDVFGQEYVIWKNKQKAC